jgi:adenylyl cyclase-associated protein
LVTESSKSIRRSATDAIPYSVVCPGLTPWYREPQQVAWVQAFYQIFTDLADYVKQFFPQGITWNNAGKPAAEVAKTTPTSSSGPAKMELTAGSAPPPPPPPPGPPPVLRIKDDSAPASGSGGFGAVFSDLNKGESVTKGLRKVDKSEMTHKNPSLRANSTVSERDGSVRGKSPVPGKKPKPESMRAKKPPRKELEGNKWIIVSTVVSVRNGGWPVDRFSPFVINSW